MKSELEQKIIEALENDDELLNEAALSVDNYNGFLGENRCYFMEELDSLFYGVDLSSFLTRIYHGYDDDTDGEFCPFRKFFRGDGIGNLVSTDTEDYSGFIDDIAYFITKGNYCDLPESLQAIVDGKED